MDWDWLQCCLFRFFFFQGNWAWFGKTATVKCDILCLFCYIRSLFCQPYEHKGGSSSQKEKQRRKDWKKKCLKSRRDMKKANERGMAFEGSEKRLYSLDIGHITQDHYIWNFPWDIWKYLTWLFTFKKSLNLFLKTDKTYTCRFLFRLYFYQHHVLLLACVASTLSFGLDGVLTS